MISQSHPFTVSWTHYLVFMRIKIEEYEDEQEIRKLVSENSEEI